MTQPLTLKQSMTLKQPWLGILASTVCMLLALAICAQFDAATFGTWVTLILVAMVPAQIVLGLVWETRYPAFIGRLSQPFKGLALLGLMVLAGLLISPLIIAVVGGGSMPPTPFAVMFTIFSVVIAFWLVIVMQCWPLTAFTESKGAIGIGVWLLTYGLSYGLYLLLFDFGFLQAAPFYAPALDPQGWFNAWHVLSFALTALVVMLALVLLDFWPLTSLLSFTSVTLKQPLFGTFTTLLVLWLSYLPWFWFVQVQGMDPVVYMVRVPASIIFGQFVMLIMMQTAPVQTLLQPLKGLTLLSLSLLLSVCLYHFYGWASDFVVGPLASGAPEYQLDLWLASAMLAVTFPLLVLHADFLGFWPFASAEEQAES
ncbi:hypothetical protein HBA55_12365 [Pseudomaricurvus alkylphenolicus]|jgi:hypothetical protein|uniref:hypothetical protein n=1 Tax=Pseudomaricurvus alkylphenolicus TaxID=1306991 RepID=UPI00142489ED|nr:hypothetical protein [Pseudomaricurvus alkylphenolicus]NIB40385.1 hypothetical protein [Pseudomaricurvus alkylphenolicus]